MATKNRHDNGANTRILLTGVFGPYAQDDSYGSRRVNPMELYHNQVTRVQGPFSLRMFHRTTGLLMIEANIDAPCTILDFPSLDRFMHELATTPYDVIGISAIIPNIGKVKKMCREIRRHQPGATIVVGGHIANKDGLEHIIDADHICKGDGIRWFRQYLGQDVEAPILHPAVLSGFGTRIMGIPVPARNMAAVVMPSVGCPIGCNFCSTSALFGGKGHSVIFYETGDELFTVLTQIEKRLKVHSFFILDENFLLYKKRALRLLELMQQHDKSWAFYVFSSAKALRSYSMEQLISLGISWVWLGLEGRNSKYSKLDGVDTRELVREYQAHGIRVLGSTIIGMEEHTPDNMDEAIAWAVEHATDFHQFMLYTPVPGTPLYREHQADGTLLSEEECPLADAHGQERFNYRHPHIPAGQEKTFLLRAFEQDFQINGPSLARIAKTTLQGWRKYRHHPDPRIVRRFRNGAKGLGAAYAGAVWAMTRWYGDDAPMQRKMSSLLREIYADFGALARLIAPLLGRVMLFTSRREAARLAAGWTYEPDVIYEKNRRALQLEKKRFALPAFHIKKIRLPVYDISAVLESYRSRIREAWHRLEALHEQALEQIAQIDEELQAHCRQVREYTQQMRTSLDGKRDQVGEQVQSLRERVMERYGQAAVELGRLQTQIMATAEQSRQELDQLEAQMKSKYWTARTQIEQASEQFLEKCAQRQQEFEQAAQQARLDIQRSLQQLQSLEAAALDAG
ncbi:MAG: cobalamin-dependent protein [Acidobacteria bacterium]|nr:cobalamin-dependent protein [Acidobacteriota bacterium]